MAANKKPTSPTGTRKGEREQPIRRVPKSSSTRQNLPFTDPKNISPKATTARRKKAAPRKGG
jgi:hypothetical protein